MTKGISGAVIGLAVGWIAGLMLQQAVEWTGAKSLVVILAAILGALLGASSVGGLVGALAGAAVGGMLGVIAMRLLFLVVKLILVGLGAVLGWRWASALGD